MERRKLRAKMMNFVYRILPALRRGHRNVLTPVQPVNDLNRIAWASRLDGRRYCDGDLIVTAGGNSASRRMRVCRSPPNHHLVVLKTHG